VCTPADLAENAVAPPSRKPECSGEREGGRRDFGEQTGRQGTQNFWYLVRAGCEIGKESSSCAVLYMFYHSGKIKGNNFKYKGSIITETRKNFVGRGVVLRALLIMIEGGGRNGRTMPRRPAKQAWMF